MNYAELMAEFKLATDWKHDPWGSALVVLFDVAAELWTRDECPGEWDYSPGAVLDPRDPDSYFAPLCDIADTPDLLRFGNTLQRYKRLLERAERNY